MADSRTSAPELDIRTPSSIPSIFAMSMASIPRDWAHALSCLISGSVSESHYPLRVRLRNLVRSGKIPGVELKHPGYWLSESANRSQLANYAAHLAMSKMVLCCSSKWHYWLGKCSEAAQAGSAVVCDTPDDTEFEATLGAHIVRIHADWSDDDIAGYINAFLCRPEELQGLTAVGAGDLKHILPAPVAVVLSWALHVVLLLRD